jgi:hypothetical protein
MKKSNIFLVSALCLAICWTLLIGWFAASAINNYLQGKSPYFARSHSQYLESHKKSFPIPVNELFISGEGTVVITILPGKDLTVLSSPRIWNCAFTDLKNGRSMITFKKLKEYEYNEPVTIMLPEIPSLSLDNFSEVTIKGLNQKEIHIQCKRVHSFTSGSCKIGILNLDFPGNKDQQDICIDKSNQIDTLIASVQGFGKIRLETIGKFKNHISLSESIKVEASYDLMKKLSIGMESRVLNK